MIQDSIVLGIDFGTTNSCISYYQNGNYHLIPDEMGNWITKSCIYFNPHTDEILYGDAAYICKDHLHNLKRLLGIRYNDFKKTPTLLYFFKHLHIVSDKQNQFCEIVLQYNNRLHQFSIEYIVKLYIKYLLERTREFLNLSEKSIKSVITVPASFSDISRNMLKNIFISCNIEVINVINEPTAAILPYVIKDKAASIIENILVIDCGGGTTDFTVLECDYDDMFFQVQSTSGDNFLGGEDITDNLFNHVVDGRDFQMKMYKKIRKQCEEAKCRLSYNQNAQLYITDEYMINISRLKFIDINKTFFDKIKKYIKQTTTDTSIDRIVFVGGTTRIPYFKEVCKDIFGNISIENTINQDHIVSMGAALKGFLLTKSISNDSDSLDVTLLDIVSMSLGVETNGGIMTPIISKGSMIPISKTETFSNADCEASVDINVYQGERKFVKDNLFLGTFSIPLSTPSIDGKIPLSSPSIDGTPSVCDIPRNSTFISVTFDITSDGLLIVTSRNKVNDTFTTEKSIVVNNYIKKIDENINNYIYDDDYDKIKDSELANKILKSIELTNKYEIYKQNKNVDQKGLDEIKNEIDKIKNECKLTYK